jgi:hypothetical protein
MVLILKRETHYDRFVQSLSLSLCVASFSIGWKGKGESVGVHIVHIRIRNFYPPTYSKVDSIQLATYDSSTIFSFLDFRFPCYSTMPLHWHYFPLAFHSEDGWLASVVC